MRSSEKTAARLAKAPFARWPGAAALPLEEQAFKTRLFQHAAPQDKIVAFASAPAFIWKDGSGTAERGTRGQPSYIVFGVYALNETTLRDWTDRRLLCEPVRLFNTKADAFSYTDRLNAASFARHDHELSTGRLAGLTQWKAVAIDAFRLTPEKGLRQILGTPSIH